MNPNNFSVIPFTQSINWWMNDALYDLEHHIINYSSIYFVCVSSLYTVAMTAMTPFSTAVEPIDWRLYASQNSEVNVNPHRVTKKCKTFKLRCHQISCIHSFLIEDEWRIYASLNWIIIGSDNGLSPVWCQAIIWTNAGILLIGTLGTNFNEIFIEIRTFSFKKIHLKMSSGKWRPFCLGLNVLERHILLKLFI